MRLLSLTNSDLKAQIDDDLAESLSVYKWYRSSYGYVCRTEYLGRSRGRPVTLHSHVIPICQKGMHRDHINGDKLDNRRENLRVVTVRQNVINCKPKKKFADIHSSFKGVSWHKRGRKWMAYIKVNRFRHYLGLFSDEREAAIAYNDAAVVHFGEYARLNPV